MMHTISFFYLLLPRRQGSILVCHLSQDLKVPSSNLDKGWMLKQQVLNPPGDVFSKKIFLTNDPKHNLL